MLLCGGTGSRMKLGEPKQFLKIHNKSVITHSLNRLCTPKVELPIVIVTHPDYRKRTSSILKEEFSLNIESMVSIVDGGSTRHLSFLNGCEFFLNNHCQDADVILVHDAARPAISREEISGLLDLFQNDACEIGSLAGEVVETVLVCNEKRDQIESGLERNRLVSIKTPQAIRVGVLKKLMMSSKNDEYTDLLGFGLSMGIKGFLAPATSANIKLTRPEDIDILERILDSYD